MYSRKVFLLKYELKTYFHKNANNKNDVIGIQEEELDNFLFF